MENFILKLFIIVSTIIVLGQGTTIQEIYRYRLINWCIIGQGEHPLYKWPLNQLKPFLLETNDHQKLHEFQNPKPKEVPIKKPESLTLTFNRIKCEDTDLDNLNYIGDGKGYLQRAHIQFASDVHFQGLVIQAVHQPFGLGFPFGQFDIDGEFQCSQCDFDFSEIVGCISRPDLELMHPTVGAFHYKLKKPDKTTGAIQEVGAQRELHWNFKWADSSCSSAKAVEFWVLIIFDFDYRVWMVKKFGPYDLSTKERVKIGSPGQEIFQPRLPSPIYSSCQPLPPSFEEILENQPIPVVVPAPAPPPGPPPGPAPGPAPGPGPPSVPDPTRLPRVCYKEYGLEYNPSQCWYWKEHKIQQYLTINERKSKIECHTAGTYDLTDHSSDWSPLRVVGDFDWKCITKFNREGKESKSRISQPYKVCKHWQARFRCEGEDEEAKLNEPAKIGTGDKERYFPKSICDPCTVIIDPTLPPEPKQGFITRGVHGGMMVFAFFFFLPVSITICRFYKETLHTKELKGWRLWLLAHVGLAMLVVLLSYISYTLPAFFELTLHMYLGYAALFCCAGGLASGWFRHKSEWVMTVSFYVHSASGYAGWGLAIASMAWAPQIGPYARILCYFASGFSLAAMTVLTCHICTVDRSIEMTPARSHIPIVQIRFDDLFPPGHKFRKFFLIAYASVQFLVVCAMMTLKNDF